MKEHDEHADVNEENDVKWYSNVSSYELNYMIAEEDIYEDLEVTIYLIISTAL